MVEAGDYLGGSMMRRAAGTWGFVSIVAVFLGAGSSASAQVPPWDLFEDTLSSSLCDVVNAANIELVVLHDSSQFVIVTGPDEVLDDSFVDVNGDVFFDGFVDPLGFIDFFEDGDGFRTMWWVEVTGEIYGIDDFTGEIFLTDLFPSDFVDVLCDACPLWDDPSVCVFDDPAPPPPDIHIDSPQVTIEICGSGIPVAVGMIFSSLMFLRFSRRRWVGNTIAAHFPA